jgi:hypothetical protein
MLIAYAPNTPGLPDVNAIRFLMRAAELASDMSTYMCSPAYSPSACVWLVPGTGED